MAKRGLENGVASERGFECKFHKLMPHFLYRGRNVKMYKAVTKPTALTRAHLLPELQLHLDLVRHRLPCLPTVFLPVILLEALLVL